MVRAGLGWSGVVWGGLSVSNLAGVAGVDCGVDCGVVLWGGLVKDHPAATPATPDTPMKVAIVHLVLNLLCLVVIGVPSLKQCGRSFQLILS